VVIQTVRKRGSSYVVTIPKEEVARLGLKDGDFVSLELCKVSIKPELSRDLRETVDDVFDQYRDAFDYLGKV
jgi:antitoxin component of MazEF toxin-antitoxin module